MPSGIVETWVRRETRSICLIEVGGQQLQRKRWLRCFEGVDMVIFVVAMSEYDQALKEDPTVNCLQESLNCFESICNNECLQDTAMTLFLNKEDVLEEKLKHTPLKVCFRHYNGAQDKIEATTFLAKEFSKCNKTKQPIYHHVTCAKDPGNITYVFDAAVDGILHLNMKEVGVV